MTDFIYQLIGFVAIPLWLLAGLCDWWCHRLTHIESNSGWRESLLHALMLTEIGLPLLAALFFEINALIFLLALTMWIIHDATALWDVSYAHRRRYLSPFEQHMHSFLELMPLFVLTLVGVAHWQQLLALFGAGDQAAHFTLRLKQHPLPRSYLHAVLIAVFFLQILPYGEELLRCARAPKSN